MPDLSRYLPGQRHFALGAFAAAAGLAALPLLFAWFTRPGPSAGMDWTHRVIAWAGVGGLLLALAIVHIVFARQLWLGRDGRPQRL